MKFNPYPYIGERFGRLKIIGYNRQFTEDPEMNNSGDRYFYCKCDCGNIISVPYRELEYGITQSCGCLPKKKRELIDGENEPLNIRKIWVTYTQDFRVIGKGLIFTTFNVSDWATILNVDPRTLMKYLFDKRGDMRINDVLEYCNELGHRGRGDHIIIIPVEMERFNCSSMLDRSIRDIVDGNDPVYVSASKMVLRANRHERVDPNRHTGERYGRLLVVGYDGFYSKTKKGKPHHYFLCRCDCGNEGVYRLDQLQCGNTRSCGCLQRDLIAKKNSARASRQTADDTLFTKWNQMKSRCYDAEDPRYGSNGGRGIQICPEWRDDFQEFRRWSYDSGYSDRFPMTFTRVDLSKDYSPDNCIWCGCE